jgi:hypothetical protein
VNKVDSLEQGLFKLLWTVYSEGKLQSCLKLKFKKNQNPFNEDTYHAQKRPKICTCEVSEDYISGRLTKKFILLKRINYFKRYF